MKNIKFILALIPLALTAAERLPEFYAFRSMLCVYDGKTFGLPEVKINITSENLTIVIEDAPKIEVKAEEFSIEFDLTRRPEVRGIKLGGEVCIEIHIPSWKPSGGISIFILNKSVWLRFSHDDSWYDLILDKRKINKPQALEAFLNQIDAVANHTSIDGGNNTPDPFSEPGELEMNRTKQPKHVKDPRAE